VWDVCCGANERGWGDKGTMKFTATINNLIDSGVWDDYRKKHGINQYVLVDGLMSKDDEVEIEIPDDVATDVFNSFIKAVEKLAEIDDYPRDVMNVTGMVSWGNGEPCPFCKSIDVPDGEHMNHIMENHQDELAKKLFLEE